MEKEKEKYQFTPKIPKFRAWDGHEMNYELETKFWLINKEFTNPDYIIMQNVGIKDKNDKDIYEGDIVRGMNIISYPNEDKIYRSGIVKYKHCGFVAVPFGMEEFNMVALGEWCEVIGNIYENPELMELWSDE